MTRWNRDEALQELHLELHRYLSAAAVHSDLPTLVDALWHLPVDFRRRLLAAHVLSSAEAVHALEDAESLLRSLPPSATRLTNESQGVVEGPVLWQRTIDRRLALADPTVFVTRPAHKSYDVPVTRFIQFVLQRMMTLYALFPAGAKTGVSADLREIERRSRAILRSRKLHGVRRVRAISPPVLEAMKMRRPQLESIEILLKGVNDAVAGGSPDTLVPALLGGVFAPASDDTLFELWTGLRLLSAVGGAGGEVQYGIWDQVSGTPTFAEIRLGGREFSMYWQRSYWGLDCVRGPGAYAAALTANGLGVSALRPDFLIVDKAGARLSLIEVKYSEVDGLTPDRVGIQNCLAYLKDLDSAAQLPPLVNAIVVASESDATPQIGTIMVCDPTSLSQAAVIRQVFGADFQLA